MLTFVVGDNTRCASNGGHCAGGCESIGFKGILEFFYQEQIHHLPFGVNQIGSKVFIKCGDTLLKPIVIKEFGGDEITEPLMGVFVRYDCCDSNLLSECG